MPKDRPPSPFIYNPPPKVPVQPPPPAAQYLPISHSVEQERIQRKRRLNSARVVNNATEVSNGPSLFQDNAYAPPAMNRASQNGSSNIYEFTRYDEMLAPPAIATEDDMMRPMFSSPDQSALYG